MRITLKEKTTSFLLKEAERLNLAPEELVESIVEKHFAQKQTGLSELRLLPYSELVKKSQSGDKEERAMANILRASFIR